MKEIEKMQAGLEYCYDDEDISMMKLHAIENANVFNSLAEDDLDKQHEVLSEILGSVGEKVWIAKRFCFDNGKNIFIGNNFTGNFNLTILDIKEVYIGDNVMIGPNTTITTVGHPLSPKKRHDHLAQASEIKIGNDVWLGANVTILPGVTMEIMWLLVLVQWSAKTFLTIPLHLEFLRELLKNWKMISID